VLLDVAVVVMCGDVLVVDLISYLYLNGCDLSCSSVYLYSLFQQFTYLLTYLPTSTVTSLPCRRLAALLLPGRLTSGSWLGWWLVTYFLYRSVSVAYMCTWPNFCRLFRAHAQTRMMWTFAVPFIRRYNDDYY